MLWCVSAAFLSTNSKDALSKRVAFGTSIRSVLSVEYEDIPQGSGRFVKPSCHNLANYYHLL
jgi:hypothetical protein